MNRTPSTLGITFTHSVALADRLNKAFDPFEKCTPFGDGFRPFRAVGHVSAR
jgi:hypothetical protein